MAKKRSVRRSKVYFGDLLSQSWKDYKLNFRTIFKIVGCWYVIPFIIASVILFFLFLNFNSFFPENQVMNSTSASTLTLNFNGIEKTFYLTNFGELKSLFANSLSFFTIYLGVVTLILLSRLIVGVLLIYISFNHKKSFKQIINGGLKYFWKLFSLLILVLFLYSVIVIPTILLFFFIGESIISFLLLLIVGCFVFWIFINWIFSPYFLIGENKNVFESLKLSKRLVEGNWWGVFGIFSKGLGFNYSLFMILYVLFSLLSFLIVTPFMVLFFKNFYLSLKKGLFLKL